MEGSGGLVIGRSRAKSLMLLALALALLAVCIFGAVSMVADGGFVQAIFAIAAGTIIVAVLAPFLAHYASAVLHPRPLLRITPQGLDQRAVKPNVFIPWSEIADISVIAYKGSKSVGITVRDPRAILPAAGPISRAVNRPSVGRAAERLFIGLRFLSSPSLPSAGAAALDLSQHPDPQPTIQIPTFGLPIAADELAARLRAHLPVDAPHSRAERADFVEDRSS